MNAWLKLTVTAAAALSAAIATADKGETGPTLGLEHQAMFCGTTDADPGIAYSRAVSAEIDRRVKGGAKSAAEALKAMNQRYCGSATSPREVSQ